MSSRILIHEVSGSKLNVHHISGSGPQERAANGTGPHLGGQILFFSGSVLEPAAGFTSNPTEYTDTNFWVSGSHGSRTTRHRGAAVFGGDMVVSGGIYHTHDPTVLAGMSTVQGAHGDIVRAGSQASMLTTGKLYYLNSSGQWTETNANATATAHGMNQLLGIALGPMATRDGMLVSGYVKCGWQGSINNQVGIPLYIDTSSGNISTDKPSSTNNFVRIVGYIVDLAGVICFRPSNDWIEL